MILLHVYELCPDAVIRSKPYCGTERIPNRLVSESANPMILSPRILSSGQASLYGGPLDPEPINIRDAKS